MPDNEVEAIAEVRARAGEGYPTRYSLSVSHHQMLKDIRTILDAYDAATKGCQCACHDFPEHTKLQDMAEANRYHAAEVVTLREQLVESERRMADLNQLGGEMLDRVDRLAGMEIKADHGWYAAIEAAEARFESLRARLADALADIEIQRARAETFAEKMDERGARLAEVEAANLYLQENFNSLLAKRNAWDEWAIKVLGRFGYEHPEHIERHHGLRDTVSKVLFTARTTTLNEVIEKERELLTAQFQGFTNADELVEKNIAELSALRDGPSTSGVNRKAVNDGSTK